MALLMSLNYVKILKFSSNFVVDLVQSTLTVYYLDINKIYNPRFSHIIVDVHLNKIF